MQPRCSDMHKINSGGKAHFLVETAQTIVRLFKAGEEREKIANTRQRHQFFVTMIRKASMSVPQLTPLADVLSSKPQLRMLRKALRDNRAKPNDWLIWRVDSSTGWTPIKAIGPRRR